MDAKFVEIIRDFAKYDVEQVWVPIQYDLMAACEKNTPNTTSTSILRLRFYYTEPTTVVLQVTNDQQQDVPIVTYDLDAKAMKVNNVDGFGYSSMKEFPVIPGLKDLPLTYQSMLWLEYNDKVIRIEALVVRSQTRHDELQRTIHDWSERLSELTSLTSHHKHKKTEYRAEPQVHVLKDKLLFFHPNGEIYLCANGAELEEYSKD